MGQNATGSLANAKPIPVALRVRHRVGTQHFPERVHRRKDKRGERALISAGSQFLIDEMSRYWGDRIPRSRRWLLVITNAPTTIVPGDRGARCELRLVEEPLTEVRDHNLKAGRH